MTAEQTAAERYTERIEAQVDELARIIAATTDTHWFHRLGPEAWTAAEVCGHIAEMLPYWGAKARQIAAQPGMTFGRDEDDAERIGGVRAGSAWSRHAAIERLRAAAHTAAGEIHALPAAGWHAIGNHSDRGATTVESLIETMLAQHLEAHVEQVRQALG
jgi:hypothetical protein